MDIKTVFNGSTVITADRNMLQQLFMNLMLNALDAVSGPGRVTISASDAEDDDGIYEIRFRDTGSGMPAEVADRIFDPFFSTKDRGTGLGMAIVSAVVEAHGGTIEVDSKPGAGTEFIIRLPLERRQDLVYKQAACC